MRDDVSMLVWIAAGRGDKDMTEFLLSSFGDIIDINMHDEVGMNIVDSDMGNLSFDSLEILPCIERLDVAVWIV